MSTGPWRSLLLPALPAASRALPAAPGALPAGPRALPAAPDAPSWTQGAPSWSQGAAGRPVLPACPERLQSAPLPSRCAHTPRSQAGQRPDGAVCQRSAAIPVSPCRRWRWRLLEGCGPLRSPAVAEWASVRWRKPPPHHQTLHCRFH